MITRIKKTAMSAAVALALAAPLASQAAVMFDLNGAAGPNAAGVDRFTITSFDWNVGNTLVTDTTPVALQGDVRVLSQASLSVLNVGGGGTQAPLGASEITYQMAVGASAAVDGDGIAWTSTVFDGAGDPDFDPTSFFDIYYDALADSLGVTSVTGCGFGSHSDGLSTCGVEDNTRILHGRVKLLNMDYDPNATSSLLDTLAPDNQAGITTFGGTGSGNFEIEIISFDPAFFINGASLIDFEMDFANQNPTPFISANPTDLVVDVDIDTDTLAGRRATYGDDLVNNVGPGSCDEIISGSNPAGTSGGGDGNCHLHMQADANSPIRGTSVPEPGSLALVGLGLAAFGAWQRRRSA